MQSLEPQELATREKCYNVIDDRKNTQFNVLSMSAYFWHFFCTLKTKEL